MLTIDLILGIALAVIGILVLLFLSYILVCRRQTKISALCASEAFATLILGLFYVICSCLLPSLNHLPPIDIQEYENASIIELNIENGSIYDAVEKKTLRDLYDPGNFASKPDKVRIPNAVFEDFINYYTSAFGNSSEEVLKKLIRVNQARKQRALFKMYEIKAGEDIDEDQCSVYDHVYYKFIMLVVAFMYGSISVINSSIEVKKENGEGRLFVGRQNENAKKSILQVLLAWLVPMVYAAIVTLTMKPTNELVTHLSEQNGSATDIAAIIEHPLNVTYMGMNSPNEHEMNKVVASIYQIMNELRHQTTEWQIDATTDRPSFDILQFLNMRAGDERIEGKSMRRTCRIEEMPIKLHTLLVFILSYVSTVFYAKLTHTKLAMREQTQQVKLFGRYVMSFAGMWLPSMLEMFSRAYLVDTTPTMASDVTLALGNVTRLLANAFNVHTLLKSQHRANNVQPITESV